MQIQRLIKLLQEPHSFLAEDVPALEALIQEYPYFYLAHMLLAKVAYIQQNNLQQQAIKRAAAYTTNPAYFHKFLKSEENSWLIQNPKNNLTQKSDPYPNNYIEHIIKKKPKKCTNTKSIEQFTRIDHVLSKDLKHDPFITHVPLQEENTIDLASLQSSLDYRLATETLAKIMINQQKYTQAKQIYKYLILKHPEKKLYFTKQINSIPNNNC